MQPTHENIDRWLFDYTEGNLSAEQEQQLELFLMNHPDLELDMDAWEMSKVDVAPMVFERKELLYKKRSYKPALALLSLLILFTTGISLLYSNQKQETQTTSINAQSDKKNTARTEQKTANTTIKRTESDQSVSSVNGPSLYTPVSTPYETTRKTTDHLSLNPSTEQGSLSRVGSTNETTHPVVEESSDFKLSNSNVPISTMEFERINLHALKGMIVGGYRTDFKNEALSLTAELDASVISLGNIKLFKKIDQLLSKDIGLSNNQSYDYTMPGQSNLDLNFSSVGTTSQTRFQMLSSIRSLENPAQFKLNNQLSLDAYSRNMRAGFGIQVNYDDFSTGLIRNGNFALIFSPKIALSRKISLEPAVRFKNGTYT